MIVVKWIIYDRGHNFIDKNEFGPYNRAALCQWLWLFFLEERVMVVFIRMWRLSVLSAV